MYSIQVGKIVKEMVMFFQAHSGAVLSLAYSPSYVVSLGEDGRLCVWERMQVGTYCLYQFSFRFL